MNAAISRSLTSIVTQRSPLRRRARVRAMRIAPDESDFSVVASVMASLPNRQHSHGSLPAFLPSVCAQSALGCWFTSEAYRYGPSAKAEVANDISQACWRCSSSTGSRLHVADQDYCRVCPAYVIG
jgi:hypothetical protein